MYQNMGLINASLFLTSIKEGGQYGHFTRCEHFWIFWVKVARGGRQFYIFLLISNLNNYYIINFC